VFNPLPLFPQPPPELSLLSQWASGEKCAGRLSSNVKCGKILGSVTPKTNISPENGPPLKEISWALP